jgi:hypothetical protein
MIEESGARKRKMPNTPDFAVKHIRCDAEGSNSPVIPHELFLSHILPIIPHTEIEELVKKAVQERNLNDLFFLVGRRKETVPSHLTGSEKIIKAAGRSMMLPIICGLGFTVAEDVMNEAVSDGHIEKVRLLRKNGCPCSTRTFTIAVKKRNFEMMKCLKELGCPFSDTAMNAAAKIGDIESMKWLRANGCPWSEWTFRAAAINGDLDIMKWLRLNGCPWDSYVFMAAAENGNLDNMKWLRFNGCAWCTGSLWQAKNHGNIENLNWMKENGLNLMYH